MTLCRTSVCVWGWNLVLLTDPLNNLTSENSTSKSGGAGSSQSPAVQLYMYHMQSSVPAFRISFRQSRKQKIMPFIRVVFWRLINSLFMSHLERLVDESRNWVEGEVKSGTRSLGFSPVNSCCYSCLLVEWFPNCSAAIQIRNVRYRNVWFHCWRTARRVRLCEREFKKTKTKPSGNRPLDRRLSLSVISLLISPPRT